jgi:putative DNA primase/helicase
MANLTRPQNVVNGQQHLEAALGLARHGLKVVRVYPPVAPGICSCRAGSSCASPGKHPIGDDWQHKATDDQATIRRLWHDRPDASVGVKLGTIIDIESDSPEAAKALADLLGDDPPACPKYQGKRGAHWIFQGQAGLPDKAVVKLYRDAHGWREATGGDPWNIEVRLGGGKRGAQSIFPPSKHESGHVYGWLPGCSLDDISPPPLPLKTAAILTGLAAHKGNGKPAAVPVDGKIKNGERDDTLTSLAGTMRRRGMEEPEILAALEVTNRNRCETPLEDSQVAKIAKSVCRYPPSTSDLPPNLTQEEFLALAATPEESPDQLATLDPKTIAKKIDEERKRRRRQQQMQQALADPLKFLQQQSMFANVPIVGVRKFGGEHGVFYLQLQGGKEITLGDAEDLLMPKKVQAAVLAKIGVCIPKLNDSDWPPFAQAIASAAAVEDSGTEPEDMIRELIARAVGGQHPVDVSDKPGLFAVLQSKPYFFRSDDHVYISFNWLLCKVNSGVDKLTRNQLGQLLRKIGFKHEETAARNGDDVAKKKLWWAPIKALDG